MHINQEFNPEEWPEGSRLVRGFVLIDGGCEVGSSVIQEIYHQEITGDRPAAKSSTSVAAAATTCRTCGCRKGPNTQAKPNCKCACH